MACSLSCFSFFRGFDLDLFWNISFTSIMASNLLDLSLFSYLRNTKVEGNKICSRHNKVKMQFIFRVETNRMWCTLWSRPKWIAVRIFVIVGENALQVPDVMIVMEIKKIAGDFNAFLEAACDCEIDDFGNFFKLSFSSSTCGILLQLLHEFCRILEVRESVLGAVGKDSVELVASPFDTVLDLVGEISQGAHWDGFLRGVLGVTVALGFMRNYHL